MPYVTSMERLAREEGALREARDLIRQTIEVRFGHVPEPIGNWLDQCDDIEALRTFHQHALQANSVTNLQVG